MTEYINIRLTKLQIGAIQALLEPHCEIAGTIPPHSLCWKATNSIYKQTGIDKFTYYEKWKHLMHKK